MGACDMGARLKGHLTEDDLDKWHRKQKRIDARENGHQEGYSGDWQTVEGISLLPYDGERRRAFGFCLKHASKWSHAVAVHSYNKKGDPVTIIGGWAAI